MYISVDEFESVTNEAFSFLLSDFGYFAKPPERGGHFGSALVRKFVKDDLTISFIFGDADSRHLCSIDFDDGVDARVYRRHASRTLCNLLEGRQPQYQHRTRHELTHGTAAVETILEYGALLREFAVDPINGDFSAFPTLVYLLVYVESKKPFSDSGKPLGIFSTFELAEKALAHRHKSMGTHERLDGYQVWRLDIDPAAFLRPAASS